MNSITKAVHKIWRQSHRDVRLDAIANTIVQWRVVIDRAIRRYDNKAVDDLATALDAICGYLARAGCSGAAHEILVHTWIGLGERQLKAKISLIRAFVGFYLSRHYDIHHDKGAAIWWQLHAVADDYLRGHEGNAKFALQSVFGVYQSAIFDALGKIAAEARDYCDKHGWASPRGLAEDVILEFVTQYPEYADVLTYPTQVYEYPLSRGYFGSLLNDVVTEKRGSIESTVTKGKKLEKLACYLFMQISGCIPSADLQNPSQSMQHDVVIRNLTSNSTLVSEILGRHFLIECKNWNSPVGAAECGYFLYRMHLLHTNFGVILAKNGITGDAKSPHDEQAARDLIKRSFHEDGLICIVLDKDDLERLKANQISLRSLIYEEMDLGRFGKSRAAHHP